MNGLKKAGVSVAGTLGLAMVVATFALSRGYFDHGLFDVKQTDWSKSGLVAMLAECSDHQALRSNEFFVLIGDHVFSPSEVRDAFYRQHAVFNASSDCLSVCWSEPRILTISCINGSLEASEINFQRVHAGEITIMYVNIPDINRGVK